MSDHLSTLTGYLNLYDYQVAYTDALLVYQMFDTETLEISDSGRELLFSRDFDYNMLVFENYIPFMCLLFESRTLRTSNGFDPDFELYEDWDLLIRIGKDHPFYHLKKVTAYYNQWSADSQISQRNRDQHLLRNSYQRILAKHIGKITPERIHDYMSGYVGTRRALIEAEARTEQLSTVLREKEASLKAEAEKMERHNAAQGTIISQLETAIRCLQEQIAEKDSLADALRQQVEDIRIDTQNLMEKKQVEIRNCNNLLAAVKDTLGWRILERYRSIRNRFFHHKWGGGTGATARY